MSKRFECEYNWIIDNNKRNTKESLIVYDEEWNTLDDLCELLNQQDQRIAELEEQLAESEEKKESYRLQNEQHHLQLLQFYSRLGVEAFGADIHEKALETLMIMKDQLEESKEENKKLVKALNGDIFINYKVPMENTKLKQQLHELPKKIVEEIREDMPKRIMEKQIKWEDNIQIGFICNAINAINECLDAILKKYGEENE